jgi:hypothetical protein
MEQAGKDGLKGFEGFLHSRPTVHQVDEFERLRRKVFCFEGLYGPGGIPG